MEKENMNKYVRIKKSITTILLASTLAVFGVSTVNAEVSTLDGSEVIVSSNQSQDAIIQEVAEEEEIISPLVTRYQGYSRENVAESIADAHFSDAKKVIIVNRDKFSDAISATNISQGRYPVLYTHSHKISESTIELLKTMSLDQIYILGGTLSIQDSVVSELTKEMGVKVTRLAGRSRYDANASAVSANYDKKEHVVIASGEVFADALYGVSYANTIDAPVILSKTNNLEESTVKLLKDMDVKTATIIGGKLTVTEAVENQLRGLGIKSERIAGRNRYIGSAEVAAASYENPPQAVIASGEVFSDALVSAPLAQKLNAPILLVRSDSIEEQVTKYLGDSQMSLENIYIQGGPLTITEANEAHVKERTSYLISTLAIPYEKIIREDATLPLGNEELIEEGQIGEEKLYYNVVYQNDELVKDIEIKREVISSPIAKIVRVGTRVDVESITLSHTKLSLIEGETFSVIATVLPQNATNKELKWSSSDETIATVTENGFIALKNVGEVTITVSDVTGKIVKEILVMVKELKIESIEDISTNITQYDSFELPKTVNGHMNNGTVKDFAIDWEDLKIDTSKLGTYKISGKVEGYEEPVIFKVTVSKYIPQLVTNSYSAVTINSLSQVLSLNMTNFGAKPVTVDKIEVFEGDRLFLTHTTQSLISAGINPEIKAGENWGISITFRFGMFLNGSYVKYYVTVNNTSYEYIDYL